MEKGVSNDRRNRRRGKDIWLKMIRWIGIVSWALMIPLLILIDQAQPQFETFFDRYFDVQVNPRWNYEVLRYAFYLMVILLILSSIGLMINKKRSRRKGDYYRINLIIIFVLSILGIFYYFFRIL
ncbi:hypothetical protein SAMN05192551_10716 [Tindallia magadiensis]|uniref:Uncharacterized protein n=2 Tax=Tindallia magadiensis TaxID=69895 RepID=A0A1I3FSE5_9FIRM|nr:hypothetical protein SAMN05192551_10716 [Tindallia magadiensis]